MPDAGSPETNAQPRIVTVLVALTQPVNVNVALGTEPFGTPIATVSPRAAPVTVTVKSSQPIDTRLPKSNVAVAERTFRIGVPPPIVAEVVACRVGTAHVLPAVPSPKQPVIVVPLMQKAGPLEVVRPRSSRVRPVLPELLICKTPSDGAFRSVLLRNWKLLAAAARTIPVDTSDAPVMLPALLML